ncbi:hypothetical protein HaLaN_30641, partial [Haematococcus lacustris]
QPTSQQCCTFSGHAQILHATRAIRSLARQLRQPKIKPQKSRGGYAGRSRRPRLPPPHCRAQGGRPPHRATCPAPAPATVSSGRTRAAA